LIVKQAYKCKSRSNPSL